jgi:hypothetical protein
MKISIEKASGTQICRGTCKKDPKYTESGRIKNGTSCARIQIESAKGKTSAFYCRDCIDKVYLDVKMILNPALWVFH